MLNNGKFCTIIKLYLRKSRREEKKENIRKISRLVITRRSFPLPLWHIIIIVVSKVKYQIIMYFPFPIIFAFIEAWTHHEIYIYSLFYLSFCLCLSRCLFVYLSLSLFLSVILSFLCIFVSLYLLIISFMSFSLSRAHCLSVYLSLSLCHSISLSLSLSPTTPCISSCVKQEMKIKSWPAAENFVPAEFMYFIRKSFVFVA